MDAPCPRLWFAALLACAAVAFGLRMAAGPHRPMHTDEAVNAQVLATLLEGKPVRYDPVDKHGPLLSYATWPVVRLLRVSRLADLHEWQVRLVPALAGALLLLVPWWLADGLGGRLSPFGAALWLGLGAPFVYYGAYWIHETLFVLFTVAGVAAGWRYAREPRRRWALLAGLCAGLLVATKETAVLTFASAAAGLVAVRLTRGAFTPRPRAGRDLPLAAGAACGVVVFVYTAGGAHPHGLVDLARGAVRFTARAGGEGHEKPWFTYLAWFGAPGLRALPWAGWSVVAGAFTAVALDPRPLRERPLVVFLATFTLAGLIVYSSIPYKTPWLALNFLAPAALLAGADLTLIARRAPAAAGMLALLTAGLLLVETDKLCVRFTADPANPLAYSPTVPDARRLGRDLETYALARAERWDTPVQVVGGDIWPLPWYLRRFTHAGYWPEIPARLDAPLILADAASASAVATRLGAGWTMSPRGLRPEVLVFVFTRQP